MSRISSSSVAAATAAILLSYPLTSSALLWPRVTSVEVYNCKPNEHGSCGIADMRGTAEYVDWVRPTIDRPGVTGPASFYGIHCYGGNKTSGFNNCMWFKNSHGPSASCEFVYANSRHWDLRSGCTVPATWQWEGHSGADIGGECSLFGITTGMSLLYTPTGAYDATSVANTGSAQCVKPSDPVIPCHIGAVRELNHGEQPINATHTVSVEATLECGPAPEIDVVGGPAIELGTGLRSHLSATISSPGTLRVESRLSASDATPGHYSTTRILVISPN